MSKYVDVEKILNDKGRATRFPNTSDLYYHESVLQYAPAEDVAPVIHAHWIKDKRKMREDGEIYDYCCSHCKGEAIESQWGNCDIFTDYCPRCGAKMDEEVNKND